MKISRRTKACTLIRRHVVAMHTLILYKISEHGISYSSIAKQAVGGRITNLIEDSKEAKISL